MVSALAKNYYEKHVPLNFDNDCMHSTMLSSLKCTLYVDFGIQGSLNFHYIEFNKAYNPFLPLISCTSHSNIAQSFPTS